MRYENELKTISFGFQNSITLYSNADQAGIHYKVLNKRKGPAVQGHRAQIDRDLYRQYLQSILFSSSIQFEQCSIEDLIVGRDSKGHPVCGGVITGDAVALIFLLLFYFILPFFKFFI